MYLIGIAPERFVDSVGGSIDLLSHSWGLNRPLC